MIQLHLSSSPKAPPFFSRDPQAHSSGRRRSIKAPLSDGSASCAQAPPIPAYSSLPVPPRPAPALNCGPLRLRRRPSGSEPCPQLRLALRSRPSPPRRLPQRPRPGPYRSRRASRREGAGGGGRGGGEKGGLLTPSLALPVRVRRFATNGPRTPSLPTL